MPTSKITLRDIKKYRIKKFKPDTREINSALCTCGGHALKIITKIDLKYIHDLHPDNTNWDLKWMRSFLKLAGFNLIEVLPDFINERKHWERVFFRTHVFMLVLGITKKESTWAVYHKGKVYHAQNAFGKMEASDIFINYPIERTFLVQNINQK